MHTHTAHTHTHTHTHTHSYTLVQGGEDPADAEAAHRAARRDLLQELRGTLRSCLVSDLPSLPLFVVLSLVVVVVCIVCIEECTCVGCGCERGLRSINSQDGQSPLHLTPLFLTRPHTLTHSLTRSRPLATTPTHPHSLTLSFSPTSLPPYSTTTPPTKHR
jgi:hypothetical protein